MGNLDKIFNSSNIVYKIVFMDLSSKMVQNMAFLEPLIIIM